VFFAISVAPHLFKFVEFSGFGLHNMYHHVHIINENPLTTMLTLSTVRHLIYGLFGVVFNIIGNGFHLNVAAGFTDDEKICDSLWYLAKIQ